MVVKGATTTASWCVTFCNPPPFLFCKDSRWWFTRSTSESFFKCFPINLPTSCSLFTRMFLEWICDCSKTQNSRQRRAPSGCRHPARLIQRKQTCWLEGFPDQTLQTTLIQTTRSKSSCDVFFRDILKNYTCGFKWHFNDVSLVTWLWVISEWGGASVDQHRE